MKTAAVSLMVCFLAFLPLTAQQKSDYATVEKFQTVVKSVTKSIETATTAQECAEISNILDATEREFKEYKELLDNSLYPDNYATTISDLHGRLLVRQRDLGIIETQVTHIAELEAKVKEISEQIGKLNGQNEKLLADIQRLSQNVQKLTGESFSALTPIDSLRRLVVQLRAGLQERDQLIFSLVDSLFLQYDKNVVDMKDIERQGLLGKVERHGIFANVKRALQDNLSFIEATTLKQGDMTSIIKQQEQFQTHWNGIAPKLAGLYLSGKQKKNDVALVDSMLKQWSSKVDAATWRSLNTLFKEKEMWVKEFTNGNEFSANLTGCIDAQIKNAGGTTQDTRYKYFTNFDENIWTPELSGWLVSLVDAQKITPEQKKSIEDKVAEWRSAVKPGISPWIYVGVVIVLLAVGCGVFFMRRKKSVPPESVPPSQPVA
jgi:hypothetical protein